MAAPGEREAVDVSGRRGLASLLPASWTRGGSLRAAEGRQGVGGWKLPQGVKIAHHAPNFLHARAIWVNLPFTVMYKTL